MTLESMLTDTVTVVSPVTGTDDYGNTGVTWDAATRRNAAGRIEPLSSQEVLASRDEIIADWRLFLGPDNPITTYNRVEWSGKTFEVRGAPAVESTPDGPHHIEVNLRYVTG
jgi:head-tail adaptor